MDNVGITNSAYNFGDLGYYYKNNKLRLKYVITVFLEFSLSDQAKLDIYGHLMQKTIQHVKDLVAIFCNEKN